VGTATIADNPGTGMGKTSGMENTSRDAPKDDVPSAAEIFSTVKARSELFSSKFRRSWDVLIRGSSTTLALAFIRVRLGWAAVLVGDVAERRERTRGASGAESTRAS